MLPFLTKSRPSNVIRISQFLFCTEQTEKQKSFPDLNTDVNIHTHKDKLKKLPKTTHPKWDGMKNLRENTKGSLIPTTLAEMQSDADFKLSAQNLKKLGQKALTKEEKIKRKRALDNIGVTGFLEFCEKKSERSQDSVQEYEPPKKRNIEVFQLNIGLYCNQACSHCHVESSPKRTEMMSVEVADKCIDIAMKSASIHTVDITGGAPELCPQFRHIVTEMSKQGKRVIDRANLTSLLEPGQEDTPQFLADRRVDIIASLPCYTSKNVNLQRGSGVFAKSIQALVTLNELGYGIPGSGLKLDLVYNPLGAYLPPNQTDLEQQYRKEMLENFGVSFNRLFTMTNMPIKRFADFLYGRNELQDYMELLVRNFNLNTIDKLMCRDTLSVNWDGSLYDCDFNQQLDLNIRARKGEDGSTGAGLTVFDIDSSDALVNGDIAFDNHCYGCTAGMGSS